MGKEWEDSEYAGELFLMVQDLADHLPSDADVPDDVHAFQDSPTIAIVNAEWLDEFIWVLDSYRYHVFRERLNASSREWTEFAQEQLAKGGGILFKFIAREQKMFLSVDTELSDKSTSDPSEFLANQVKFWEKCWANPDKDRDAVAEYFQNLLDLALKQSQPMHFDSQTLDRAAKGYS